MDYDLKRRASRNFGRLAGGVAGTAIFAALSVPFVALKLSWSGDHLSDWIIPVIFLILVSVGLWDAALQAQKIRSFVPLKVAAATWGFSVVRALSGARPRRTSPAWSCAALLLVLLPVLLLFWLGPQRRIEGPGAPWTFLCAYLLSLPIMAFVLRRAAGTVERTPAAGEVAQLTGKRAPAWRGRAVFSALAVFPTLLFLQCYGLWDDAHDFAPGLTTSETLTATVSGRCSQGRGRKWMMWHCAHAETATGRPIEWQIQLDRLAQSIHDREGRVCVRVTLEHGSGDALRIEGGTRRYRSQDLVPCQG